MPANLHWVETRDFQEHWWRGPARVSWWIPGSNCVLQKLRRRRQDWLDRHACWSQHAAVRAKILAQSAPYCGRVRCGWSKSTRTQNGDFSREKHDQSAKFNNYKFSVRVKAQVRHFHSSLWHPSVVSWSQRFHHKQWVHVQHKRSLSWLACLLRWHFLHV